MAARKPSKGTAKTAAKGGAKKAAKSSPPPRAGGTRISVFNSGLEVWLYDDANLAAIRAMATAEDPGAGGMPGGFESATRRGLVVGYSLYQDDGLDIEVHVGTPFSATELEAGRWLAPQHALLRLPSGALRIESNDASRLGPEPPTDQGVTVAVPPGDYRLTLLRVDHEALDREGIAWTGAQEYVILTPGGTAQDAATDLLPFEQHRDLAWVGRHTLGEGRAEVLVWFNDSWDTFFVNLDAAACARLGLAPGRHFRTRVPAAGLTMVSVFGESWEHARRLPPPANVALDEYGYAAVITPQDWAPAEALFCRREKAATRAEDAVHNTWIPATLELLDADAHPPTQRSPEAGLIDLGAQDFFEPGFLSMVLGDLLPGVDDLDDLPLADAIARLDRALAKLGLTPQGDIGWTQAVGAEETSYGARLYTGGDEGFAAIVASEADFNFVFVTERADGTWVATGIVDGIQRLAFRRDARGIPVPHPTVTITEVDETPARIRAAHRKAVGKGAVAAAPEDLVSAAGALSRFLATAATAM